MAAPSAIKPKYWRLYWQAFRWVMSSARRPFILMMSAQVVGAVALAVGLFAAGVVVERLTGANDATSIGEFVPAIALLGVCLSISGLTGIMTQDLRLVVGELVSVHLQQEIVSIAGSVDYEQYERQDFHDLLNRATTQGIQSSLQIVYDIASVVSAVATSVAMVIVIATSVPEILPVIVLIALPFLVAARVSARMAFQTMYELTPNDRLRLSLYNALTAKQEAKELRVFELQPVLRKRWLALCAGRIVRIRRLVSRRILLNAIATLAGTGLVIGVLAVIVYAALDDRISIGDAAVAIVALQQLAGRVRGLTSSAGSLRQSALFLDDFERFRALEQPSPQPTDQPVVMPLTSLRVEQVTFRYPGTDVTVLHDVDLEIHRGEVVALVGISGSGKTTLAHLVAGLYRPTAGRITWDGHDISELPREEYWRSLAVVFQDFSRYELTAHENIGISDHRRSDDLDAIRDAAKRAGISGAIDRLPAGYESMLSRAYDDGVDLSVGQWQRIAVARAFFRDASLLVLDEPAAALDPLAEQALYERLAELCTTRSVLLISHRFSTVRLAHRIYVMREGRIVEHGTHRDLIDADGHYAQLFRAQAEGYVDAL